MATRIGAWILLVVLVSGVSFIPAYASVPDGYSPVGPGDIYLALGDSLTTGTEADGNNDNQPGYPPRIHTAFQTNAPGLAFHNLGQDGEDSTSMLEEGGQLDQALAYINAQQSSGKTVGVVTLGIGGNDMVQILPPPAGRSADGEATLATFTTNLDTILQRLTQALEVDGERRGDLILMDYYNPYPDLPIPPTNEKIADIWMPRFNEAIHEAAATYGLPVAEVAEQFDGRSVGELTFVNPEIYDNPALISPTNPNLSKDLDYHPRVAGHTIIADQFVAVSGYQDSGDGITATLFLPLVLKDMANE